MLALKMDIIKAQALKKLIKLKLQIYSSPWSVAYEGRRAMELKVRLAINIFFDIATKDGR